MDQPLPADQLDMICNSIVSSALSYSLPIAPLLDTLNVTGLRINEVYQLNRWSSDDGGNLLVALEKGSGIRSIPRATLPPDFLSILDGYPETNWQFTVRQVRYFIRANTGWARLSVGGKEICTHLFRYNYSRQLYQAGWSPTDVRDQLKHRNLAVTNGYLTNPIVASVSR